MEMQGTFAENISDEKVQQSNAIRLYNTIGNYYLSITTILAAHVSCRAMWPIQYGDVVFLL